MASERDEIIQFLSEKGVKGNCPRCNSMNWNISDVPSPWGGLWGANADGSYSLESPIHGAAMMMCTNCGYISLHSKYFFELWKQKKAGGK
ncbi:hypothetical protein A6R70_14400 [Agrobacterium rubi]|nr:hypothetical protein [Agrobacterium rubi]